ncbi:MAG: NrfD/PsrC family molybdoenzyme membrane anchor subunit [Planctomycetota bacterium]
MDYANYVYPNEQVEWGVMIVMYPYITGLVAGAFIISSLHHVFGDEKLAPVAKLSLLKALAFAAFACTPLLLHLGHPERSFFIMIRPNLRSAMSGFGFIYTFYLTLLCVEIWFVSREQIVERTHGAKTALGRLFYSALSLGAREITDGARRIDKKIVGILAGIGIPAACILHGYVGFIFGSIKANAWWSTPLMPLIFLLSAVVSGTAMLLLIYLASGVLRGKPADPACLESLTKYLWGFLIFDATFEFLEIFTKFYEGREEWPMLQELMTGRLEISFIWIQFIVGCGVPLLLLAVAVLFPVSHRVRVWLASVSSLVILIQVLAMRWNVVVGGQLLSKSAVGFHHYEPEIFGIDGIIAAVLVFLAPFVLLYILVRILPPFEEEPTPETSSGPSEWGGWGSPPPPITPPRWPSEPVATKPFLWS